MTCMDVRTDSTWHPKADVCGDSKKLFNSTIPLNSYTDIQFAKFQTHISSKRGYCVKITSQPC